MDSQSTFRIENTEQINTYDLVPYVSDTFPFTHPDLMATLATIFGLKPVAPRHCRVLELGCAGAGNIIPMAYNYPESHFVGVDFSRRQIDAGKKDIDALGLKNIELKRMNILDIDKKIGNFDYIIVHGIYSWVPKNVQDKLLSLCNQLLNPNGVAYISFNTYPGWHFRGAVREMMLYHTANAGEPEARAREARAFLEFLSESVPVENSAYGSMLKAELKYLSQQRDDYIIHEYLEERNEALYFYQFAERIHAHGLQYLAECEFYQMLNVGLPDGVGETLERISDNQILKKEQYLDFLRNRYFRRTLICREDQALKRSINHQSVLPFFVACSAEAVPENIDIFSSENQSFQSRGLFLNTSRPLVKAAFKHLLDISPQSIKIDDLHRIARENVGPEHDASTEQESLQVLCADLLTAFAFDMVTLRTEQAQFVNTVSEYPIASLLSRYQSQKQERVSNQLHQTIFLDVFYRNLLLILDGSRDKNKLLEGMKLLFENGTLAYNRKQDENRPFEQVLEDETKIALAFMAKNAFLVG